jgi:hypothetical protein
MNQSIQPHRILSIIALTSRGFGYAVLEDDNSLVEYGKKHINADKNARSLKHVEKLIVRYQPEALILDDVNAKGTHRDPRIKELHRTVVALANKRKLPTIKISGTQLRTSLLGNENGTKHEMAEFLAAKFPDELDDHLPPKRPSRKSEDIRMDMFDAVGLSVVAKIAVFRPRI